MILFWSDPGQVMEGDCVQSLATARLGTERTLLFVCSVVVSGIGIFRDGKVMGSSD